MDHLQLTDPQGTGVSVKADGGVSEDAEMRTVRWELQTVQQKGCSMNEEERKLKALEGFTHHSRQGPERTGMEGLAGYKVFDGMYPSSLLVHGEKFRAGSPGTP